MQAVVLGVFWGLVCSSAILGLCVAVAVHGLCV